ncbi:MAG: hypothetical protein ACRD0J_01685, partial [Acidimicrobiales bacterium]
MLILLPVALLVVALAAFIVGFLQSSLILDYASIAASALSFILVLALARLKPASKKAAADPLAAQVQGQAQRSEGQRSPGLALRDTAMAGALPAAVAAFWGEPEPHVLGAGGPVVAPPAPPA